MLKKILSSQSKTEKAETQKQVAIMTNKEKNNEKGIQKEGLTLPNYEWDLLVKKLSSIVSKAAKMELLRSNSSATKIRPHSQIKDKALECLDIIKHRSIKN